MSTATSEAQVTPKGKFYEEIREVFIAGEGLVGIQPWQGGAGSAQARAYVTTTGRLVTVKRSKGVAAGYFAAPRALRAVALSRVAAAGGDIEIVEQTGRARMAGGEYPIEPRLYVHFATGCVDHEATPTTVSVSAFGRIMRSVLPLDVTVEAAQTWRIPARWSMVYALAHDTRQYGLTFPYLVDRAWRAEHPDAQGPGRRADSDYWFCHSCVPREG
jgi:hypothetical protein